jgi:hypothetical protein
MTLAGRQWTARNSFLPYRFKQGLLNYRKRRSILGISKRYPLDS